MRTLIDANVVLRYLLEEDAESADAAERIIRNGAVLLTEVACEVVFVLSGFYKMSRAEICSYLTGFIDEVVCPDGDVLKTALFIYKKRGKLDFVDAILAARHQVDLDRVETFDRKLANALKLIDETGSAIPTNTVKGGRSAKGG